MSDSLAFSDATRGKIHTLLGRYPRKQGALIPVLYLAQDEFGWLRPEVMELVAKELELPVATVLATATFYTMLYKKPVGRFHVQICVNVSCYLLGSDELMSIAQETLGIAPGQTSSDGLFSLEAVQCLCACDRAPTLQINQTDYFKVKGADFRNVLTQMQTEGTRLGPRPGWLEFQGDHDHHAHADQEAPHA